MMNFIKFLPVGLILTIGVLSGRDANASVCAGPGKHLCGAVKNRTGRTMHITRSLAPEPKPGGDACDVWNWDGLEKSKFRHAGCSQEPWSNGPLGGNGTGDDIDAFTFNGEGYHERYSRVGPWHWRKKGVWTKIDSGEIEDCGIGDKNEIWCTRLVQVP
jgi:hypothetical protein